MNILKQQWVGVVAILLLGLSALGFGGGDELLGSSAVTTVSNPWTFAETSGTSTVTIEAKTAALGGCVAIEQSDGSGYGYFTVTSGGNWATSTTGC